MVVTNQLHARMYLPQGKNTGIHCTWHLVDHSVGLDVSEKQKLVEPTRIRNPDRQASRVVYNRLRRYAISAVLREYTYSMEQNPSWEADQFLQLTKKFPAFYGTRRFITVLTSARHLFLSWANSIQSPRPPSNFLNIHLNIIRPSTSGVLREYMICKWHFVVTYTVLGYTIFECKEKIKFALKQATKAQMGIRCTAVL
jgi:hypothetical protein